jgi:uncharacterized protein YyaL (SSP411 family)
MPNRLAGEPSPYLRQHADNPVDWYPWGPEALARARERDMPLLVSIGYSACHWCHVMAHESFEDPQVAALMNENFVCIKVDREERPDVDAIYMEACQAMTGQGGWPLNVFLTPEQVPFYAGTYFPPERRMGMASWREVLEAIAAAWQERRAEIRQQSARMVEALSASVRLQPAPAPIGAAELQRACQTLRDGYDHRHGGWGRAPKFPAPYAIELLLARGEHDLALDALRAMARGGIYDQVGGGFHRYSVNSDWSVPHFEKMLYDNAQLARAYLRGWLASGDTLLLRICRETLDFALAELRAPEGGFYSALDADSEGVEGRYYVWSAQELSEVLGVLGPRVADEAMAYFGATEAGNFEPGLNVLQARGAEPQRLAEIRRLLADARATRVRPGCDDKRLASWNALMLAALAEAGAALEHAPYLEAARGCAEFLLGCMSDGSGRMLRSYKDGQARLSGCLEDHAFTLQALLALYEATFEQRYFEAARLIADSMIERFGDPDRGGFFSTASDAEPLLVRRKDLEDSPIPSGNSAAALGLLRLARVTGEQRYERAGQGVLALIGPLACRHPHAFAHLLAAADFNLAAVREVAIVGSGPQAEAMAAVARRGPRAHLVLAGGPGPSSVPPLLEGREAGPGGAAAYVCERFACRAPVHSAAELAALLGRGASPDGGPRGQA